jgi:uncharacterized protein (TIGR03067 family)
MRVIEDEWRSLHEAYRNTRDKGVTIQKMKERLFRTRFSEQDLRKLVTSCDSLSVHFEDRVEDRFSRDVLAFMVKSFVDLGDRVSLVELLSKRCPSRIHASETIEYYLAFHGKRLKDPILVLGEAYATCEEPETRDKLAAAVRRGFADYGIRGEEDDEYVKNAMEWYEREKARLVANRKYPMNETSTDFTVERYENSPELYDNPKGLLRYPLFEKTSGAKERSIQSEETPETTKESIDDAKSESHAATNVQTYDRERDKFKGTWEVVKLTSDGQSVPNEQIKGVRFLFREGVVMSVQADGTKKVVYRIKPGSQEVARAIDLAKISEPEPVKSQVDSLINELSEETSLAIYEFERDLLRIASAKPGSWRRPISFESAEGSDTTVIVLKSLPE